AHLFAHLALQLRLDVAEKDHPRALRLFGELRLEVCEDVELRVERVRSVEVEVVASAPEEGLALFDAFEVVRVDPALLEDPHLLRAEVAADDADDAHVRKET